MLNRRLASLAAGNLNSFRLEAVLFGNVAYDAPETNFEITVGAVQAVNIAEIASGQHKRVTEGSREYLLDLTMPADTIL